ncbi:fumarylacetoacetate hydrolase family protein [Solimonas marina]|uniref:Fumarylacetoacetate hydrolase family protein n=1 Tax=Solimonas marina TaxID=2714601 RepID=A0A969W7X7_9GAMM|nr:fumarylacetoacetate hydrolase family protein [Solimonas marina]NKF22062.1 fumarylacetoacetate hydrolase family protein [Solimonas marina]
MKLATLKNGSRDGALVIVSRDLTRCVSAAPVAATLQGALDRWHEVAAGLAQRSDALHAGALDDEAQAFDPQACHAPLPRAYQWADGSAYVNHVELVRRARGAEMPASFWTDPLMYQGGSDSFLDPHGDIVAGSEAHGIDFEAEVAVVTDDVPMGVTADAARTHIRLVLLVNDVSLRGLIPGELAKGFGFFQSKPSSAFAPCALTPDEFGAAWDGGRLHRPMLSFVDGQPFGKPDAGVDMTFDFGQLVAHAAKTRPLAAGTVVGSGTVSNRDADGGPGRPIAEGGLGYSCLAELRTVETLRHGAPQTPFLKFGSRVRIEMQGEDGTSLFGAIEQTVRAAG